MAIYETHYHFEREPFSLSPDPAFFFASHSHREALAQLRYLTLARKGFAVLTGEVGTGKTLLMRTFIESVGPQVRVGYIFNPPATAAALYAAIADELDIALDPASPVAALNRFLLKAAAAGETILLIFDEAQNLSNSMLEEIRLLTNIETSSAKLLQVILAGQTELDLKLDSYELRALRQRLVFRHRLAPLRASETFDYINARLRTAGTERALFTTPACRAVYRYSGGIPRLINVICDNAILSAYADGGGTIDAAEIDEVAADLRLSPAAPALEIDAAAPPPSFDSAAAPPAALVSPEPPGFELRRRRGFIGFVCALATLVVAVLAVAGWSAAEPSFLAQVNGFVQNAIRWLGGSAQGLVLHLASRSNLFRP